MQLFQKDYIQRFLIFNSYQAKQNIIKALESSLTTKIWEKYSRYNVQ